MYQQPYPSSNRLSQSIKLATIHALAATGYILVFLFIMVTILDSGSLLGILLLLIFLPVLIVTGMLAAYIYTTSFSRYFACRIGYFQAVQISFGIGFQIFLYGILAMIFAGFVFFISLALGFLLFVIIYLLFPLTVFYFVQEWVLENSGNTQLSRNPNRNYVGYISTLPPPMQQYNSTVQQPQYAPQQQYQQPQQQYQQPPHQQPQPPVYAPVEQPVKHVETNSDGTKNKVPVSSLNFCKHCGDQLSDASVQYCANCGKPVST